MAPTFITYTDNGPYVYLSYLNLQDFNFSGKYVQDLKYLNFFLPLAFRLSMTVWQFKILSLKIAGLWSGSFFFYLQKNPHRHKNKKSTFSKLYFEFLNHLISCQSMFNIHNVMISTGKNAVLSHLISNIHNYINLCVCTFKLKKNCLKKLNANVLSL